LAVSGEDGEFGFGSGDGSIIGEVLLLGGETVVAVAINELGNHLPYKRKRKQPNPNKPLKYRPSNEKKKINHR
jgi:hypothetical protein